LQKKKEVGKIEQVNENLIIFQTYLALQESYSTCFIYN